MNFKFLLNLNACTAIYLLLITFHILFIDGAETKKLPITKSIGPMISSTTTTTSTTTTQAPTICIEGIKLTNGDDIATSEEDINGENFVQSIAGDAVLSVMTRDPTSALFVINRINQVNLITGHFDIGIRTLNIQEPELLYSILLQEVEYLQHCVDFPIGVFIDQDLYRLVERLIDDLEYNIWPIPSTRSLIFSKVAHLLYEMPWGNRTASVEILGENDHVYNDFMDAARNEHMCIMHFRSPDNIYVLLGNKMVGNFKENGTIFVVPTGRTDKSFISDLPGNSYVLMENEVELRVIDDNKTQDTLDPILQGKNILSSELLAISGPLLHLTKWINISLHKNCEQTDGVFHLESCGNFLTYIKDWQIDYQLYRPSEILEELKITKLANIMTFEMLQKVYVKLNSTEEFDELKQIASQNFITNVTTQYNYNQMNKSKRKFGQVFTCQYADGTNRKFPFYYDGESVMYWRLRGDAWVAAGLTAAILGIIVCVAILVFIVVRITIGDVFEGNPMSSMMLLLTLIVLFGSFIPFSMEYVSDHRNSQVTYEDVDSMNTLCAVRIFLITLCYCLIFSLLLCRALMLASIGSEGGFLSHVNGYIQSVICVFSTLVQIGLSTQLLVVMHIANESISCENLYYGHWFWGLLTYDFLLLMFLVFLSPLIVRSQRNYKEGILVVVGSILCLIIWCTWISLSVLGDDWRDAAIPLGAQATGWAILSGILIPRSFLIVRGIERSDIAQALPSLTSLAFAQNQYASEQSVYECVNPAMRHCSSREDGMCEISHIQSPSEIPTLPLRGGGGTGGGRRQLFGNFRGNNNTTNTNRRQSFSSSQSSLPPSPNKITRF